MQTDFLSDLLTPYRPGAEWTVAIVNTVTALALLILALRLPRRLDGAAAPDLNAHRDAPSTEEEPDHDVWIERLCFIGGGGILFGALLIVLPENAMVLAFAIGATVVMAMITFCFIQLVRALHDCAEASRGILGLFATSAFFVSGIGWSHYEMEGRLVALLVPAATLVFVLWLAQILKDKLLIAVGLFVVGVQLYGVLRSPPAWRISSDFFSPQATSSFVLLQITILAVLTIALRRAPINAIADGHRLKLGRAL